MSDTSRRAEEERGRPWAALAFVLVTLLIVVADLKGLRDLREARATAAGLEERIEDEEGRLALLEKRRSELVDGEAALERLAREDLGMVRPGELVIVLPEAPLAEDEAAGGVPRATGTGVDGP